MFFTPAWWDPIRSKPVAGYWHDVIDCSMVPYDACDHFWANFSIVKNASQRLFALIRNYLLVRTKLCEHKNASQRLLALIIYFTEQNCVNIKRRCSNSLGSFFACRNKIMLILTGCAGVARRAPITILWVWNIGSAGWTYRALCEQKRKNCVFMHVHNSCTRNGDITIGW